MKFSLNWLKDYVSFSLSADQLSHKLTMAGLEVEKIEEKKEDKVFELEITPNRSDCLSMLGLAREVAAILDAPRTFPKTKKISWPKAKCDINIQEKQDCLRYIGTLIKNVNISPSPKWMIERLESLELRAINNVVDITNFCLMETGQPLHVFDYDKLIGGKIVVRRARKGERIVTIDDVERELDSSVLIIADEERPVAIAGIMGGKDTEVTKDTKNILLESAYFDSVLIRRTSRKLGVGSDSSYRFERGVDINMVEEGANRAIALILDAAKGEIINRTDKIEASVKKINKSITISAQKINDYIGSNLTSAQCKNILKKLDFQVTIKAKNSFVVIPPSFRPDVKIPVDVIEEVARVIGYDNLPLSFPKIKAINIVPDNKRVQRRKARELFIAQGFNETVTFTLFNRKNLLQAKQEELSGVLIRNPLTQDQEMMRPSMLPSMLSVARSNINRGQKNFKFFEIAKIYNKGKEKEVLGMIAAGNCFDDWREMKKKSIDFFDLKGAIGQVFMRMGIDCKEMSFLTGDQKYLVCGEQAEILLKNKKIGEMGSIDEDVLSSWDIKQQKVWFAQIDIEQLYKDGLKIKKYVPVCEFPVAVRDISLGVERGVSVAQIEDVILKTAREFKDVQITDLRFVEKYEGDKVPQGYKGVVFSLTYQSSYNRTLRDEEVSMAHEQIRETLKTELSIIQR